VLAGIRHINFHLRGKYANSHGYNLKKELKIAKLKIINYVSVDSLSSKAGYLRWLVYLNQT